VHDIAAWLEGLGLGRYAPVFERNEIDLATLPHLSDRMLQEMGLPVGPRAKVLVAIANLPPTSASDPLSESRKAVAGPDQQPYAERRQITVLFCDLVDSTELARSLDPEDLKFVMEAYRNACGAVIERHQGHVAQYRGDSVEAYFGWPEAVEGAAEYAVRAGLDVVQAVKAITSEQALSVRIGISTGIVVTNAANHGGASTPAGVFGDTPYIAARLQTVAKPDSVVISDATSRQISGRFVLEALGPQTLKGISEPIHASRVRLVRDVASRFRVSRVGRMTPLAGRRTELAWLHQQWSNAKDGEGQVAYISGLPGIGKSRLVYELEQSIAGEPHLSFIFQCLPHNTQSPLFPIIQLLRQVSQIAADDSDQIKLQKLRRLLAKLPGRHDKNLPLIAGMMSVQLAGQIRPAGGSPAQTKHQTLSALVDLLIGLSTRKPVFCVLEDAQWIDASTQELLDRIVGQIGQARVFLVVTSRPDHNPGPGANGNVSAMTISRLPRRDVTEMARNALADYAADDSLINRLVDESDSVPLFIEELARGLTEARGTERQRPLSQQMAPPASWSVPESLRDSLTARLDRAPQALSVARIAAVLGREFSTQMLRSIAPFSDAEIDVALAGLEEHEIIQQVDSKSPPRYAFKHALLRDAAYESLLKARRREIHANVAAAIESASPDIVRDEPELLAYHYDLAGNVERAAHYWLIGGHRARGRSANVEAIAQFENAQASLLQLPRAPERNETQLEIQIALGLCFVSVHGYSADVTRSAFERALVLSSQSEQPLKEVQAIFGIWGHYWMTAQHERAIELSQMLLAKARSLDDPIILAVGHRALGSTLFTLGKFFDARESLEKAIALTPNTSPAGTWSSYAVSPRIAARLLLGWNLWLLGFPDQALDAAHKALQEAKSSADPYSIAFSHYVVSAVHLLRGEFQLSYEHAHLSMSISAEHRINLYELYSRFGRGCARARMGETEHAMEDIRAGISGAQRANLRYMQGFMLGWLATVQLETGDADGALVTIDEATKGINDSAGRACEGEIQRLRGDAVLASRPDAVAEAERIYQDALSVTQRQHAHALALRVATSLARLLQTQRRDEEAYAILAPIHAWFTEGFDTADLREAASLLGALDVARRAPT